MRYQRLILAAAVAATSVTATAQTPDTLAVDSIPDTPVPARATDNTASITLGSAGGYNRVEGLPVLFGPVLETKFRAARLRVAAFGIIRSAGTFRLDSDNL